MFETETIGPCLVRKLKWEGGMNLWPPVATPLPPKQSGKVRPVIAKFVCYNDRRKIYINKKLIKGIKLKA